MIEIDFPLVTARVEMANRKRSLADFASLHAATGALLQDWVRRNFRAHGALLEDEPSGWPPLSPATLSGRRRRGLGTEPLIATGRLYRGFTLSADAESVEVANPVPYAIFHQQGRGVPRRAIFPQPEQAARIVFPAAVRHVEEALA